jgi:hypothetical protein
MPLRAIKHRWDFTMFKATDLCTKCLKKTKSLESNSHLKISQDISSLDSPHQWHWMALDGTGSQFDLTPDTIPAQAAVCPHFQKVVRLIICSGGR